MLRTTIERTFALREHISSPSITERVASVNRLPPVSAAHLDLKRELQMDRGWPQPLHVPGGRTLTLYRASSNVIHACVVRRRDGTHNREVFPFRYMCVCLPLGRVCDSVFFRSSGRHRYGRSYRIAHSRGCCGDSVCLIAYTPSMRMWLGSRFG